MSRIFLPWSIGLYYHDIAISWNVLINQIVGRGWKPLLSQPLDQPVVLSNCSSNNQTRSKTENTLTEQFLGYWHCIMGSNTILKCDELEWCVLIRADRKCFGRLLNNFACKETNTIIWSWLITDSNSGEEERCIGEYSGVTRTLHMERWGLDR